MRYLNIKYSVQQIVTCDRLTWNCSFKASKALEQQLEVLARPRRRKKKEVLPRPRGHVTKMSRDVRHVKNHVTARSQDFSISWPQNHEITNRVTVRLRDFASRCAQHRDFCSKLRVFVVRPTVKESIKSFAASWLRLAVGDSLIALFVDDNMCEGFSLHSNCRIKFVVSLFLVYSLMFSSLGLLCQIVHGLGKVEYLS